MKMIKQLHSPSKDTQESGWNSWNVTTDNPYYEDPELGKFREHDVFGRLGFHLQVKGKGLDYDFQRGPSKMRM